MKLRRALDLQVSELLGYDLLLAVGGAVGGGFLAGRRVETLAVVTGVAAGFVGVVIGAVVAGVAIQGAFTDEAFLRKSRRIGRDPVYYLQPLLFTVFLGVAAALCLLVLAAAPNSWPTWLEAIVGASAGFFVTWTLGSLLSCMRMLAEFAMLKYDASEVLDEHPGVSQPGPGSLVQERRERASGTL